MKTMKILIGVVLLVSVGLNVYLWQERAAQLAFTEATRTGRADAEAEALRGENEMLKTQGATRPVTSEADTHELARLRNEVGQLRKQTSETESLRAQAAEARLLRAQLTTVTKDLAVAEKDLAEAEKLTPEEALALKGEAQSTACINNMKQIGLAVLLYANDHGKSFPPELPTLKNELVTPKVLFCPAASGGVPATDWAQLTPGTISYQFLNPNGNGNDPHKPLITCPLHGHIGLSDGSVHANRK